MEDLFKNDAAQHGSARLVGEVDDGEAGLLTSSLHDFVAFESLAGHRGVQSNRTVWMRVARDQQRGVRSWR